MTALAQQISKEIIDWYNKENEQYGDTTEYLYSALDEFLDAIDWRSAEITLPSGIVKQVEQKGGEGEGSEYWVVFSVNGDTLFRVEGYYSSWEGTNWDSAELVEVVPVQVLVTQYKPKVVG